MCALTLLWQKAGGHQHLPTKTLSGRLQKEHKLDITEAFQVPTAPLGLYPGKLKSFGRIERRRQRFCT